MVIRNFTQLCAILSISIFVSCSGSSSSEPEYLPQAEKIPPKAQTAIVPQSQTDFVINKSNGEYYASINYSGDAASITYNGKTYQTDISSGKKTYYSENSTLTRIKDNGQAFKLKDENGQLLWKIKMYGDKVKISNNEENRNPYEIKIKSEQKAKLYKNGNEIAEIKFKKEICNISGTGADFTIKTQRLSPALLILACNEIPSELQLAIIAELLQRGI